MAHKMDKDLPTIISTVKGLGLLLQRSVSHQFFRFKTKGVRSSWTLIKCLLMRTLIGISRLMDRRHIIHRADFRTLLPCALYYFFGHTLVQKGADRVKGKEIVHRVTTENYSDQNRSILLVAHDEDDESYDVSGEDDPPLPPCHPGHPWGPIGRDCRVHSPLCGRVGLLEGTHRSARGNVGLLFSRFMLDQVSSFLDVLRFLPKEGRAKKG
ncbi:hypothetical protein M9H77_07902 [Catharanthus roseus]|uniref:Uncharacterized protein n=1 Tax=Catharanthus roseus TaxID=4058 RepID=A0ACC0BWH1_CATRO|nr:hypothetical protein M9H77_07902 [Catharanthus roseus]